MSKDSFSEKIVHKYLEPVFPYRNDERPDILMSCFVKLRIFNTATGVHFLKMPTHKKAVKMTTVFRLHISTVQHC